MRLLRLLAAAAEQEGEKPEDATNPIAAAIGKGNADVVRSLRRG